MFFPAIINHELYLQSNLLLLPEECQSHKCIFPAPEDFGKFTQPVF
jgi:hypothetical protein